MSDGYLISEASGPLIQQAIDYSRRANPFGPTDGQPIPVGYPIPQRGYLMQSVSRGEQAACQMVSRNAAYRCWKIDLAGVIYLNHPDGDSRFQLRITIGTEVYDTEIMTIDGLTVGSLLTYITSATAGLFDLTDMVGALGHPCQYTGIIQNADLYPELPSAYKIGDMIDSLIGSWIIGFSRSKIQDEIDIQLLFTVDGTNSVQLNGPAVMTIQEISDCPTNEVRIVTDIMDIAQPTPLRGGTKVALLPFGDVGLGIIAANPREYLFQLDYE